MAGEFLESHALIFLAGLITLPAGLAIVLTHNVWTADWRVVITILGWLCVIGGIIRIAVAAPCGRVGRSMIANAIDPASSAPRSISRSAPALLLRLSSADQRAPTGAKTMNKPISAADLVTPEGHDRPARRLAQDLFARPRPRPTCACRCARSRSIASAGEPPLPVYDTTGAYTDTTSAIDVENGPQAHAHRMGEGARRRRGI